MAAQKVFAVGAGRLAQHHVLHLAVRVRVDLVDAEQVERRLRGCCACRNEDGG
jgi:hypothetical protein